ncbi:MAG: hypothetical protein KBS70_07690 [Bacteroidales bacterium]|nr:hypothetical protein [Candidatus Colicola caccequi]MBQ0154648.1 hypothetical protein [Candidatus Colicola equi]
MDHELTTKVQNWLQTPASKRDLMQGATYLLQLSGNRIMYRNISANPKRHADDIAYQLQKYLNFRIQSLTHDQVEAMQKEVDTIVAKDHLDVPVKTAAEKKAAAEEFKKGKRTDHDSLPENIQACFKNNLAILQKMRNLHTKLQLLSTKETTCPDSERYPFLKDLIALDKEYHANWKKYDEFVIETKKK